MIYDSRLEPMIEEQRRYNESVGLAMPPRPGPLPDQLPAQEEKLVASGELNLRILQPAPAGQLRGVYLHFHGGGFRVGSAANADRANSILARALSIATVSVDYRLAPQFAYPAPYEDALSAAHWLIEHAKTRFGTERLLIGGDSVGASLAVTTLLRLRDQTGLASRFCGANLVVGCYDFSMTPSQRASSDALFLSPGRLAETRDGEFPGLAGEALRNPEFSSLYADLSGLPPAIFTIGTRDAVLDDSLFMAMRWRAAGNHSQLQVYPEGTHSLMAAPTAMAAEAQRRVQQFLLECLT